MTDDFEKSLRDALAGAVPTPPEQPDRARGARAYSRRVRRARAATAVGVAAAVVGAIVVIPSVLASSGHTAGPGVRTPPDLPTLVIPPLAHPFTCAAAKPDSWMDSTPPAGVVPPGAVLARICPIGLRVGYWSAPAEPLVTGVDGLISELNALPKGGLGLCPGAPTQHSYTATFQYPDGAVVSVYGVLDPCPYISVGPFARSGAETLLRGYLDRLHEQRTHFSPPESVPSSPACLSARRAESLETFIVDHRADELLDVRVCRYQHQSNPTSTGSLSIQQVKELNADIAAHASRHEGKGCRLYLGLAGATLITGVDRWGDRVKLLGRCSTYTFVDRDGTWYWTPTQQTSAMLESVLRAVPHPSGRVSGRLLAVGGAPPGLARPLSGHVTLEGGNTAEDILVRDGGRFSISLAPGRFRVVGYSPAYGGGNAACYPLHRFITVRAGQTTHVNVYCQER